MPNDLLDVLLVEDNPGDVRLIAEMFGEAPGRRVNLRSADSMEAARRRLSEAEPDVVLLDLTLPDSRGFDTIDRMQEDLAHLPIIVLTGLVDDAMALKALGRGAQDYLVKGRIDGPTLRRSIGHAIERKRLEDQLRAMAYSDALTGLPNRACFVERIDRRLGRSRRDRRRPFAVLILDLDRFKDVNDTLGRRTGDEMLVETARRMRRCVGPSDMLARLSGDEFAVLQEEVDGPKSTSALAERLLAELVAPIAIGNHLIQTSAGIGIATSAGAHEDAESILRDADMAMHRAKADGKGRVVVFDPVERERLVERVRLETDLWRAVRDGEFELFYQPIVSLQSRRLVGFEALIRWMHPERGAIPPDEFIPIAEEVGAIHPIGQWAIEEACRQASRWSPSHGADAAPYVSVNVSGRQFSQRDLPERIERAMLEARISPDRLRIELTESAIIDNADRAAEIFAGLKKLGLQIYLDDFGTGFSSLNHLYRHPVDVVKIDRSFADQMNDDMKKLTIVGAIVSLAALLGLEVIAEGVETESQLHTLERMHCAYGQGFLFSRPLRRADAEALAETDPIL